MKMNMNRLKYLILMIVGSFMVFSVNSASAQPILGLTAGDPLELRGPVDPAEVESFLDGLFNQQMEEYHFAGITAVMIKEGQVLFQKGYGYADLEKKIPVDPAETPFRIGSVTKLFTWTAVLQLYEQGKLDLEADINQYLDFRIPDTFPEPITLKQLMSHTGGFEDRKYELAVLTPEQIQPTGQFLATHMPARVYSPGKVSAYSNYGTDLAGYIVERVSGMPYADYIEKNILVPLEMAHTSSRQPLPEHLMEAMSNGYVYTGDTYRQEDFQLFSTPSCGAMSSTADDMARFMIAHLQGGSLCSSEGKESKPCGTILKPATEQLMQSSLWGADSRVPGYTHGFMELNFNGQRILFHPGDTTIFQSMLMLLPDQKLGFFYAYNTSNPGVTPWDRTLLAFMQHYYPVEPAAVRPAPDFSSRAQAYTGNYFLARSSYTTIEKVNNLNLQQWVEISDSKDGALLLGLPISPVKVRLQEIQPGLFREASTGLEFGFRTDDQGGAVYMYDAHQPSAPWIKMPWHANPMLHYGLLLACTLIFLSALLAALVNGILSLSKKREGFPQSPLARLARWTAGLVALLDIAALIAFLAIFFDSNGFGRMIGYGQMAVINAILTVWLLATLLTVVLVVLAGMAWKRGFWGVIARLHYTLVALAALAFTFFLNYWNLLGYRY